MPSSKLMAAVIGAVALAVIPAGLAAAATHSTTATNSTTATDSKTATDSNDGPISTKIVGGTDAVKTFSFMGSLQNRRGDHMCGTTLISSQWAVTAGHCALDEESNQPVDPALMAVRFGSTDRTSGGQLVGVSKTVVHPDFQRNGTHDIALLRLNRPVSLKPAKIASASPRPGTAVRLLGWGQTCPVPGCEKDAPRDLQQLGTRILSSSNCQAGFDPNFELCVKGTTNRTACFGDSGGPALVNTASGLVLVGATSRGGNDNPVCGTGNAIYTDVTAFRDFIAQATGQDGGDSASR